MVDPQKYIGIIAQSNQWIDDPPKWESVSVSKDYDLDFTVDTTAFHQAMNSMSTSMNEATEAIKNVLGSHPDLSDAQRRATMELEKKARQEEINKERRPWFDSLTQWNRDVAKRYYVHVPDTFPENWDYYKWAHAKSVIDSPSCNVMLMLDRIPVLKEIRDDLKCPSGGCRYNNNQLYTLITHLNDHHNWSFGKIGDHLDTLGIDLTIPMPNTIGD